MKKLKLFCVLVCSLFAFSCEEKISEDDLNSYKSMMDVRLGHLGNAIIIQGRLLDAFNLRNDRADEDHFKEAEELVKGNLELFGRPDELKKLSIPSSGKLRKIHSSLIEASELLIQASNALEDNAWLGGSVSYAERNLEIARVNFQTAIKEIYAIDDDKEVKPAMEPQEYEVGEKPERFDFKKFDSFFFPVVIGFAFGFGWTPCIGPILGSILALASIEETLARAILLLSFYSLGLAIPFILSGYYMSRFLTTRKGFSKYYGRVTKTGGVILLLTGILISTNQIQVISYYILTIFPFLTTLG